MIKISVSSLPYNNNIIESLPIIINSGADFLHLDIMDGSLTENITFDYKKVKEINNNTTFFLDCHLMVKDPDEIASKYVKAGVNIITIHYEAFEDKNKLLDTLKALNSKKVLVGLSVFPDTNLEEIKEFEEYFDLLLIMSVEIGKYGQTFIEETFNKIKVAREMFKNKFIEVDGGVNEENINKLKELGVDIVVVGSSFKNAENKEEFITNLKN